MCLFCKIISIGIRLTTSFLLIFLAGAQRSQNGREARGRDGHEGSYQSQNGVEIPFVSVHKKHRTPVAMTTGLNNSEKTNKPNNNN